MEKNIKKWIIIRYISIMVIISFIIAVVFDIYKCLHLVYPLPMMGVDAMNWTDKFLFDLVFIIIGWSIPLIASIVLLILSFKKTKKIKNSNNG